jgi:hypothetical protein
MSWPLPPDPGTCKDRACWGPRGARPSVPRLPPRGALQSGVHPTLPSPTSSTRASRVWVFPPSPQQARSLVCAVLARTGVKGCRPAASATFSRARIRMFRDVSGGWFVFTKLDVPVTKLDAVCLRSSISLEWLLVGPRQARFWLAGVRDRPPEGAHCPSTLNVGPCPRNETEPIHAP